MQREENLLAGCCFQFLVSLLYIRRECHVKAAQPLDMDTSRSVAMVLHSAFLKGLRETNKMVLEGALFIERNRSGF